MKLQNILSLAAISLAVPAFAAVTAEEAKQLGTTLTEFGAIKAGNADGSIPAYAGGLTKAPAGFKADSGFWVDPFKDEKPVLRIDSKNMAQHAALLSEGQKQLLSKNPSYYLNVYPTHRTAAYPKKILDATVRNATTCKTTKEGLAIDRSCRGGMPFPIPKTGYEVMWNQILRYQGEAMTNTTASRSWVVDSSGKAVMTAEQATVQDFVYYQTNQADRDPDMVWRTYSISKSPARRAGEMTGLADYLDPVARPRRAWSYTPGLRRVKLSPEFSYDTPVASMGGVTLLTNCSCSPGPWIASISSWSARKRCTSSTTATRTSMTARRLKRPCCRHTSIRSASVGKSTASGWLKPLSNLVSVTRTPSAPITSMKT